MREPKLNDVKRMLAECEDEHAAEICRLAVETFALRDQVEALESELDQMRDGLRAIYDEAKCPASGVTLHLTKHFPFLVEKKVAVSHE